MDVDTGRMADEPGPSARHSEEVRRSVIQRERAVTVNPPQPKRGRQQLKRGSNNPKNISVSERTTAFPNEYFETRTGKLFCSPCSEFVSLNLTTLRSHVKTKKHCAGKLRRQKTKLKERGIVEVLREQDKKLHAVGEMLPDEQRVYRIEVVESFLSGGIALHKVDALRHLLEKHGHRLATCSNLAQLIPTVHGMEMKRLREEMDAAPSGDFSVIFDGSTRLGEAIVIILRYIDSDWEVQQRLVRIDVVAKSVNADDLSRVLMECLFTRFQLQGQHILAMIRDGAAVNGAAVRIMRPFMPQMFNVVCFSHALDNVGKHFDCPTLDEFGQHWVRLFSSSCRAKLEWKEQTGQSPKSFSETRWWSRWEVYDQLLTCFGDVRPF